MKKSITENGNLRIEVEGPEDRQWLQDTLERVQGADHLFLAELLEYTGWQPNGQLTQLRPAQVGALTDSPMMSDLVHLDDAGELADVGAVFWYPAYEALHFGEVLLEKGFAIWARARDSVPKATLPATATA